MATLRDNATRVKRFRALKATLWTDRSRLLVGIDVAQAAHVGHLRHAHTRVVVPTLTIPNTPRGFATLWARIQSAQRSTGDRGVGCGLEPTGTYHQAVASFLEQHGADVLLLSSSVAYWNRRTQDGTWDKSDRKDAANCADLLEQGKVLFYSRPAGPLAELRPLVKCLRRARSELAACKARWRTTLRPSLAPAGAPLPNRLQVELPMVLQAWERVAPGRPAVAKGRLPLGLATACADLGAQVEAVQARIAALEAACTPVAERLPASGPSRGSGPRWPRPSSPRSATSPGSRSSPSSGSSPASTSARSSPGGTRDRCGSRRAGAASSAGPWSQAARGVTRTASGRARLAVLQAKRQGDRAAGFTATVELAAKLLRIVWGVWRRGTPYDPRRTGGLCRAAR